MGSGPAAAAADIVGYTLVDADTDRDLQPLAPGSVLDLATLPTRNLNIRANPNPATVGSVVFSLSGPQRRTSTENVPPYALFSDFLGDYFPWTPPVGSYVLTATPFDGAEGTGAAGTPLTISFSVINSVGSVSSYTLVNADTNLDLLPLTPGIVLDLAALPTRNLNIRTTTSPATVGSVEFSLTGPETRFATENIAPYALFSDFAGNYFPWTPTAGTYTLTATPFAASNGGGAAGSALTLTFTFTGVGPLAVQLTAFTATTQGPAAIQLRWTTASEENNHAFEVQRSADGRVFGVLSRLAGHGTTTTPHDYRYTDEQPPAGPALLYYRLRQVDTDGTAAFSPVRVVARRPPAAALEVYSSGMPDGVLRYAYFGPTTGTEQLEVYTLLGQRQGRYPLAAGGTGTLLVPGLPSGVYILRLTGAPGRCSGRFVLP